MLSVSPWAALQHLGLTEKHTCRLCASKGFLRLPSAISVL